MIKRNIVGIDNGVSGSIGIIQDGEYSQQPTPVIKQQDYTKKKKLVSRVDIHKFIEILRGVPDPYIVVERPMINPGRFQASLSAIRCLESMKNVFDLYGYSHSFIDSKDWQKVMLPSGTKGDKELKKASLDIGTRLFPHLTTKTDFDGILIAEFVRRRGW